MQTKKQSGAQRLLWMTDTHFEKAPKWLHDKIIQRLEEQDYDMAIITGDIATTATLPTILHKLAEACGRRRLYIVLGNHDFHGSSVRTTITRVNETCKRHGNLTHLSTSTAVRITDHTTLVGHHGLSGQPDQRRRDTAESCLQIRRGIFSAVKTKTRLIVATHYPPFRTAVLFNSKPCTEKQQAYFCNPALGYLMIRMAKQSKLPIDILAGHTHHTAEDRILTNLQCSVGKAGPFHTGVQGIVMV